MTHDTSDTKHPGPLSGLKVIDLTQYILGPVCTQILGDMGADVIKVGTPEGDLNRDIGPQRYPHMAALFLGMNRNKRSVVLDLHNPSAKQALYKMVKEVDVFIYSTRKKATYKLGIDYETLSAINPKLIYAAGQGYTSGGRDEHRPAYDDVIQGESGISGINHLFHAEPYFSPMAFCDKFCGSSLASAVSMALYSREKTGMGQQVELPMLETVMSFNLIEHLWTSQFDQPQESLGYGRALMKERKPFATQDGFICLIATSDLQWSRLFKALGAPEMATDSRYEKLVERVNHFPHLYAWIGQIIQTNTIEHWLRALNEADIPCGKVRMLADLPTDPYLQQTKFFPTPSALPIHNTNLVHSKCLP